MDPILISITAFIAVSVGIAAIYFVMQDVQGSKAEDRLQSLLGRKGAEEDRQITKKELFEEGATGISKVLKKLTERWEHFRLLFQQADSPIGVETFFLISGVCAFFGVAGAAMGKAPLPIYPVAGLAASSFPLMWLMYRRSARLKRFANQLPDAMELIARALRSGHSLASGLHVVVEEMPEPICTEFNIAYEEQNLGIPLDVALKNIFRRVPNMDFKFFVTAVAIQRQAGGDLAEILDKIGHIIRERFRIQGQVQALTGEGRISGIVLMVLPVALFFAVYYLNKEYVMLLFTEELGRKMIAVAVVLQLLGAYTIKKIIEIKI
jgi:tight adherence protein B